MHVVNRFLGNRLSETDLKDIRMFNYKVDINMGTTDYDKLRRSGLIDGLDTLLRLQSRICFLTGIKPVGYPCCINSCVCFTGQYSHLTNCPICGEVKNDSRGRPRHLFQYIPLIPQLVNLFLDKELLDELKYRGKYDSTPSGVGDIFDGEHYRRLLREIVRVGGEHAGHRFFELISDIALALSTDGVGPFKSRKKTC
ncbi:hypothetical protein CYLTODRAFT_361543, partial [Cylindrobasidium torrendii FP15055 ss-10]